MPCTLNSRWKKGIRVEPTAQKVHKQALSELQAKIERKVRFSNEEEFLNQERQREDTEIVESPLKNLPSPFFKAVNSNGR